MAKLIVLSIVLFMSIIPIVFSTTKSPQRVLRTIQWATFFVTLIWAWACRVWYPQLVTVD
jgi:hypothetical protein